MSHTACLQEKEGKKGRKREKKKDDSLRACLLKVGDSFSPDGFATHQPHLRHQSFKLGKDAQRVEETVMSHGLGLGRTSRSVVPAITVALDNFCSSLTVGIGASVSVCDRRRGLPRLGEVRPVATAVGAHLYGKPAQYRFCHRKQHQPPSSG